MQAFYVDSSYYAVKRLGFELARFKNARGALDCARAERDRYGDGAYIEIIYPATGERLRVA